MSNYQNYTLKQRKAWGAKMAAARAAKARSRARPIARKTRVAKGRTLKGRGDYAAARRAVDEVNQEQGFPDHLEGKVFTVHDGVLALHPDYHNETYSGFGSYKKKSVTKSSRGIGEKVGATIGAGLGKGIHQLFKAIAGFGDYNVESNTLMTGGLSPPQIVNSANHGGFIVRHREYLGDINATTAFTLQSFPLNPGMAETFPWLSSVANSFEQYKWRGIVFEFKSLSSDAVLSASTSSALGAVVIATEYNSLNSNFEDKNEMENHEFSNSRKPSLSFLHPVECKRSLTSVDLLYVRNADPPNNADLRLYDLGKTEIATVGMQAASGVAGELWVTYEVELYKPQVPSTAIDNIEDKSVHYYVSNTVSGSQPFGTSIPTPISGNLSLTLAVTSGSSSFTFDSDAAGENYLVLYYALGAGNNAVQNFPITVTGGTIMQLFNGNNPSFPMAQAPQNAQQSISIMQAFVVQVVGSACKVTFGNGVVGTGTVAMDLVVTRTSEQMVQLTPPNNDDDKSIEDEEEIPEAIKRFLNKKGIKL